MTRPKASGAVTPPFSPYLPDASRHKTASPEYLRELRLEAGLSARQVAELLGISTRHLYAYELGESPIPYPVIYCVETINRLAVSDARYP